MSSCEPASDHDMREETSEGQGTEEERALPASTHLGLSVDDVDVRGGRLVDLRVGDDEEHLWAVIPAGGSRQRSLSSSSSGRVVRGWLLTFLGRRMVTRVMPGTRLRPRLARALRALRSARDCGKSGDGISNLAEVRERSNDAVELLALQLAGRRTDLNVSEGGVLAAKGDVGLLLVGKGKLLDAGHVD